MVQLVSYKGFEGLKVVAPCTYDDILIEVIFVYIFSLKPFGFWIRQLIESVYIFPETLWILETPIHRKPLFVYIFSRKPFGIWRRQFIESVYIFPETLWILETPIHWKPLSTRGPSIPLKLWSPWIIGTLEILSPAHHVSLISARSCVMLGHSEVWGRGGGTPYPLKPWGPWNYGPVEPLRPKLDFRSLWNFQAEIVLCWAPRGMGSGPGCG